MRCHTSLRGCLALCLAPRARSGRSGRIEPVAKVDLSRYMGAWRIIASARHPAERDFVDAVETYQFEGRGRLNIHSAWRDQAFTAPLQTHACTGRVVADGTNARWKLQLFPFFSASYLIVALAPDYSSAAVAHPSRRFGWILARERHLPEDLYQAHLQVFAQQGYDPSQFRLVPQRHEGRRVPVPG